ncbi:MAG: hypothetical protein KJZ47_13755 [Gemmatimonadales bacterium]|nr:hypothetical protein [Gemmatimonadales bacterium]
MSLRPLGITALLLLAVPLGAAAQSDSAQVVGTLGRMLGALYSKDAAALRAEMDSAARMTLLRPAPGGGVRVVVLTADEFIQAAMSPTGPALDEPIRIKSLTLDGDLATVWAEYQVRIDGAVSHCGHDAFHLVRRGSAWRVLTVADTFRREGCGPAWTTATIDPTRRAPPGMER